MNVKIVHAQSWEKEDLRLIAHAWSRWHLPHVADVSSPSNLPFISFSGSWLIENILGLPILRCHMSSTSPKSEIFQCFFFAKHSCPVSSGLFFSKNQIFTKQIKKWVMLSSENTRENVGSTILKLISLFNLLIVWFQNCPLIPLFSLFMIHLA